MRLPDFVMIGAAKSGTTSLHALLDQHPDIFMSQVKEPEFFARDDHYAKGIEDYAKNFEDAGSGQLAGEASTIYSLSPFFPETPARMALHMPKAKLIYVMRQPVDRAYSFYIQIIKNYQKISGDAAVNRSFEEFVDPDLHKTAAPREKVFSWANAHLPDDPDLCLAGSDYVTQIEAWLAHFPRSQILFLKFEDFVADRPGTMRKVTDFLERSALPEDVFERKSVTRNVSSRHFRNWEEHLATRRLQKFLWPLWPLRQMFPKNLRSNLRTWLASFSSTRDRLKPPDMTPQTRAQLRARYIAKDEQLRALTGLNFDDWWR